MNNRVDDTSTGPLEVALPSASQESSRPLRNQDRVTAFRARATGRRLVKTYGVLVAWIVEIVIFGFVEPSSFLTVANFKQLASSQADLVILSLAVVPTLAVAEIDLSIASVMAFGATAVGQLNGVDHWSIWAAIGVALLGALAVGLVNGIVTVYLRVRGIIVTLGMGTLVLGLTVELSHSLTVGGVSKSFQDATSHLVFGISASFYYALALAAVLWYVIRHTPIGRHLLFTGFNQEVARLSGVAVAPLRLSAFLVGSVLACFAGIISIGLAGGADPSSFQPFLLPAFAATFLGMLVFTPGRVNAFGNVVALYFLATGVVGLELLGVGTWIEDVFYGAALVGTVALSGLSEVLGLRWGSSGQ